MGNFADTIKNTSPAKGDLSIFFMGQAGFIIKDSEGKLYAIDVYFSDCCEREFGFKRLMPKILEPSEVVFDYVITTHGHFDHLDIDAIPTLMANGRTELYTTRDGIEECEKIKITERVNEIRRGDTLKIGNLTVTAVFCDHGELAPHAVGFVIEYGGEKIYLVGDSAYSPDKVAYLADENINIMFVPINGAFGNLNEEEAVKYVELIKPGVAVPCHYGNFKEHGGSVEKYNAIFSEKISGVKNVNLKIGDIISLKEKKTVYNSAFKNVAAVAVETERVVALLLPDYGCRLVSIKDKATGYELLEQDKNPIFVPQTADGDYAKSEVSAFDDMFPTIDPFTMNGKLYPCHGEVCRVKHSFRISENKLICEYTSPVFDYTYKKVVSEGDDGELCLSYSIINNADEKFDCLWAGHIMLSGEEGAVATLPVPDGAEVDLMFDTMGVFGKAGDKLLLNEGLRSQAKFRPGESNYKYYVKEKIKEGKCAFFNPKLGKHILIKYDADKLPYLGIWVNDGGFKDMYNFAFEPATLPYDNTPNAAERGLEFSIAPHESYEFEIKIDIE